MNDLSLFKFWRLNIFRPIRISIINKIANFKRLGCGGGLVIRLFTPTEYDISTISIKDSTNNALFQKHLHQKSRRIIKG